MADQKISELQSSTPQDADNFAIERGALTNWKVSFQALRTWLEGFFASDADLTAHIDDVSDPHAAAGYARLDAANSFSQAQSYAAVSLHSDAILVSADSEAGAVIQVQCSALEFATVDAWGQGGGRLSARYGAADVNGRWHVFEQNASEFMLQRWDPQGGPILNDRVMTFNNDDAVLLDNASGGYQETGSLNARNLYVEGAAVMVKVIDDVAPQLGGNLDTNGFSIDLATSGSTVRGVLYGDELLPRVGLVYTDDGDRWVPGDGALLLQPGAASLDGLVDIRSLQHSNDLGRQVYVSEAGVLYGVDPVAAWSDTDDYALNQDLGTGTGGGPWIRVGTIQVNPGATIEIGERIDFAYSAYAVNKTGNRTGIIEFGVGINGADPLQSLGTAPIASGFAGAIANSGFVTSPQQLTGTDNLWLYSRIASADNAQFGVDLDGTVQPTELTVSVIGAGGGAGEVNSLLSQGGGVELDLPKVSPSLPIRTFGAQFQADVEGANLISINPAAFASTASEVPAGGTTGQVLKKDTGTDYDFSWQDEASGGGDVIKDGPTVNTQVAVWSGDGTLAGGNDLIWSGASLNLNPAAGDVFFQLKGQSVLGEVANNITLAAIEAIDTTTRNTFQNGLLAVTNATQGFVPAHPNDANQVFLGDGTFGAVPGGGGGTTTFYTTHTYAVETLTDGASTLVPFYADVRAGQSVTLVAATFRLASGSATFQVRINGAEQAFTGGTTLTPTPVAQRDGLTVGAALSQLDELDVNILTATSAAGLSVTLTFENFVVVS